MAEQKYIPLKLNKRPAISGWADADYACSLVQALSVAEMVGLRCDGLVVIDFDTIEAAEAWAGHAGPENFSDAHTMVRTPRGLHVYYAWSEGAPIGPAVGIYPHPDIRAGSGSYVVVPPSPGYKYVKVVS